MGTSLTGFTPCHFCMVICFNPVPLHAFIRPPVLKKRSQIKHTVCHRLKQWPEMPKVVFYVRSTLV